MRPSLFLACMAIMFASCRSYQINTVSSAGMRKNDSTGVFTVENDSLSIRYSFAGNNSPVNVEVYNKLNEPMVINWERSALVVKDKAYSYVDDNLKITGETSGSSVNFYGNRNGWSDVRYNSGTLDANVKLSKNESFLPPHSMMGRSIFVLGQIPINNIDKSAFTKTAFTDNDGITQIYSKTANFSIENSPLKFKSYLTLYTLKDNQPRPFYNEQEFFISNITKLNLNPRNVPQFSNNPGDIIMNSKKTGFAKTMTTVGIITAVAGVTAADAAVNKQKP